MEKFNPQHYHLVLSLEPVNLGFSRDNFLGAKLTYNKVEQLEIERGGKRMLLGLVEAVKMVPVTLPQVKYVDYPGNEGPTGSINLATSHIAFHYWTETGRLELDLYSCKPFNDCLIDMMRQITGYFGPMQGKGAWVDRNTLTATPVNIEEYLLLGIGGDE